MLDIIIKIIESRIESIIQISGFVEGKKLLYELLPFMLQKLARKKN